MKEYFYYLMFGSWQGLLSIVLVFAGLTLVVFWPKQQKVFGSIVAAVGVITFSIVLGLSQMEVRPGKYQLLVNEAKEFPVLKMYLKNYLKHRNTISHFEYFVLQRQINEMRYKLLKNKILDW